MKNKKITKIRIQKKEYKKNTKITKINQTNAHFTNKKHRKEKRKNEII